MTNVRRDRIAMQLGDGFKTVDRLFKANYASYLCSLRIELALRVRVAPLMLSAKRWIPMRVLVWRPAPTRAGAAPVICCDMVAIVFIFISAQKHPLAVI